MSEIYSFIAGVLLGLSLAVPPGPINAAMAVEAVKRSHWSGIKIGLGAITADIIFMLIALVGVSVLFTGETVRLVVSVAGGLILGYIGIMTIKAYNQPLKDDDKGLMSRPYLVGFTMGITNPMSILWWISAGAAFIASFNEIGLVGFIVGILLWVTSFSTTLHYANSKIKGLYPVVTLVSGLCLVFFCLLLFYNGYELALKLF